MTACLLIPSDAVRFDPLTPIHKAVRQLMFEVLTRVGALDASDIFEVDLCSRQVARLVGLLPASAARLEPLLDALHQRETDARAAAAATLYQALTQLVSDELLAQLQTEAERLPVLQARHTDLELRVMRRQQLAAMSEPELAEALRSMAEALTPQELAAMIDDLQMSVGTQAFGCLLDTVRRQTASGRWERLARELGLPETGSSPSVARATGGEPGTDSARSEPARRAYRADRYRLRAQ